MVLSRSPVSIKSVIFYSDGNEGIPINKLDLTENQNDKFDEILP